MKSTTVFALAASVLPFALAAPYVKHAERDAEVDYKIDVVTDIQVATVYVTEYYTGAPAAPTSIPASPAPETTSSAVVRQKQHGGYDGGWHGHWSSRSSVEYTIQSTTTPEPSPTSTSTPPPPPPPPSPTTSSTPPPPPPPQPTTSTTSETPAPTPSTSSTSQVLAFSVPVVQSPSIAGPVPMAYFTSQPNIPTANYATQGDAAWTNDNVKAAVLQSHNAWRAKWDASPLTWDDGQAGQAQGTANECSWDHTRVGQNYAAGDGSYGPLNAVNSWGDEAFNWERSSRDGSSAPVLKQDPTDPNKVTNDGTVGHFTQVNWKATTKVGCGFNNCGGRGGINGWFLVCNYDPIGNFGNAGEDGYVDPTNTTRHGSYAMNVNNAPVYVS